MRIEELADSFYRQAQQMRFPKVWTEGPQDEETIQRLRQEESAQLYEREDRAYEEAQHVSPQLPLPNVEMDEPPTGMRWLIPIGAHSAAQIAQAIANAPNSAQLKPLLKELPDRFTAREFDQGQRVDFLVAVLLKILLQNYAEEIESGRFTVGEWAGLKACADSIRNLWWNIKKSFGTGRYGPLPYDEAMGIIDAFRANPSIVTIEKFNATLQARRSQEYTPGLEYDIGTLTRDDHLRFRVLKDLDFDYFRMGEDTNSCQRMGGEAESAVIDSFINPTSAVVVLEWLDPQGAWVLLSQSWFHYAKTSGGEKGYILDNVEDNERNVKRSGVKLEPCYAYLARKVQEETGVDFFVAGKGYSDINSGYFKSLEMDEDPRQFGSGEGLYDDEDEIYSDFDENDAINLLQPKNDESVGVMGIPNKKRAINRRSRMMRLVATCV